jgi:NADH-quinone oxidoreductase subunit J
VVVLALLAGWATRSAFSDGSFPISRILSGPDVRQVLWDLRKTDAFGQLAIMFAGIYGVIVLFKGLKHDE